jgi:hypothetical protein
MSVMDHRPRAMPWLLAAAALLVIHKLRLVAWYAIEDADGQP